jgi:hypothetical protein
MYAHPLAGRFDHTHGDENYSNPRPEVTAEEVLVVIANNTEDETGLTAREWIKQLGDTDALFHLLVMITKDRHNPAYRGLVDAIKTEIEGYLP